MPITFDTREKLGKIIVIENGEKMTVNIYRGNCLAVFVVETKEDY